MLVWVVDSSPVLVGSSQSFGSGWISKKTLPRAEQGQAATKLVPSTLGAPPSAQGVGQGRGSSALLPKLFVALLGLLSFHYFPRGEEECSAAWESTG